jgi:hypothetical protein
MSINFLRLMKEATDYYKTLFGPGTGNMFEIDPNLWHENVNVREDEKLTKPFSEDEIRQALFSMERNKAARPDGFSIEFYQAF